MKKETLNCWEDLISCACAQLLHEEIEDGTAYDKGLQELLAEEFFDKLGFCGYEAFAFMTVLLWEERGAINTALGLLQGDCYPPRLDILSALYGLLGGEGMMELDLSDPLKGLIFTVTTEGGARRLSIHPIARCAASQSKDFYPLFAPYARLTADGGAKTDFSQTVAKAIVTLSYCASQGEKRILLLRGEERTILEQAVAEGAAQSGYLLLLVDVPLLVQCAPEVLCQRLDSLFLTVLFHGAMLCFSGFDKAHRSDADPVFKLLRERLCFCAVISPDIEGGLFYHYGYLTQTLELPLLSPAKRLALWMQETAPYPHETWKLNSLADGFAFTEGQIQVAVALCRMNSPNHTPLRYETLLDSACQLSGFSMGELAANVPCCYDWEQLIVTPQCKASLKDVCSRILNKTLVYETKALLKKPPYGGGVSVLFYGPPGTGKTMAAQVIAKEIGCRLYRIDLSQVMEKYVGESEKKLKEIFTAASRANVLLFFDEADSLFTKRTGVAGANDRYANAQTAFLLQCMEDYEGMSVLATNLMGNFDEAFKRRIQYVIHFPLPTPQQRLLLWEQALSKDLLDGSDINLSLLAAQFEISGSNIKSIATAALFKAVGRGEPFCQEHLFEALREELNKQGRVVVRSDFLDYERGLTSHIGF